MPKSENEIKNHLKLVIAMRYHRYQCMLSKGNKILTLPYAHLIVPG